MRTINTKPRKITVEGIDYKWIARLNRSEANIVTLSSIDIFIEKQTNSKTTFTRKGVIDIVLELDDIFDIADLVGYTLEENESRSISEIKEGIRKFSIFPVSVTPQLIKVLIDSFKVRKNDKGLPLV